MTAQGNSSQPLVFITYNDTHSGRQHDPKTRLIVRKRAFNASRKNALGDSATSRVEPARAPLRRLQHRFRINKRAIAPDQDVDEAEAFPPSLSPFAATLSDIGSDGQQILEYYHHEFRQNSLAINVEGDWLPFILHDPASIQAQLALVALNMTADSADKSSYLRHSSAASKHIRNRLSSRSSDPDATLVGAVALLTIAESMQDDQSRAKAHFDGLNAMLKISGGYEGVTNKALQRVIAWARRCYCIHWHDLNMIPGPVLRGQYLTSCFITSTRDVWREARPIKYSSLLPNELLDVLAAFQIIDVYHRDSRPSAKLLRSDAIYEAEYGLIQLYDDDFAESLQHPWIRSDVPTLFHIAAHIYVLIVLRQILRGFTVVQVFARWLEDGLAYFRAADPGDSRLSGLMLWIETLHCISTVSISSRVEGAKSLSSICDALGISKLDDFRTALKEVCWIDGILDDDINELWTIMEVGDLLGS